MGGRNEMYGWMDGWVQLVRDSASRLLEKEVLDIEHMIRKLQLEMARQTAEILRLEQVGGGGGGASERACESARRWIAMAGGGERAGGRVSE